MEKITAVFKHSLLVLTWLVLWRLSVFTEYAPYASIWFPPAGFTFTCFLLLRWQALPAMFIACVLSTGWESLVFNDQRSLEQLLIAGSHFALLHCHLLGASFCSLYCLFDCSLLDLLCVPPLFLLCR